MAEANTEDVCQPYIYGRLMIIPCITDTVPERATANSAGVDLRAAIPQPIRILPGRCYRVPTGLEIELPVGTVGLICPRSGLALNHSLTVLNAPGIIDPDYRGEIGVLMFNHGSNAYIIEPGARIAQLVVLKAELAEFVQVPVLAPTGRGTGGFGSTGEV